MDPEPNEGRLYVAEPCTTNKTILYLPGSWKRSH